MQSEKSTLDADRKTSTQHWLAEVPRVLRNNIDDAHITECLTPLTKLSAEDRLVYAELASALLECNDRHADVPGVLDIPRATLQRRITSVRRMFGTGWHDRDSRLAIMLALRIVLPQWRAEGNYARLHPRARIATSANNQGSP